MVRRTVLIDVQTINAERVTRLDNNVRRLNQDALTATNTFGNLSRVANAVITSLAVRRLAEYADAWTNVQNRLRQVTADTRELNEVTEQLFIIAQNSRAGLQSVAQLYFRVSQSAKEFGATQEQVRGITESLANQLAVAGLTAGEVNSVLLQTSQAFNRGKLNGDEFRAISEALPSVLRSVAKELGVTRDQLNDLSEQGAITSRVLANSLINTLEKSREILNSTEVTISQTTTRISNSFTRLVGTLDNTLGATEGVQDAASFLIDTLDNLNAVVGTGLLTDLAAQQFAGINADINETIDLLGLIPDAASQAGSSVTNFLSGAFKNIVPNIRAFIKILTVEIASFLDRTSSAFKFVFSNLTSGNFDALLTPSDGTGPLATIEQVREQQIASILKQRDAEIEASNAAVAAIEARIAAIRAEAEARRNALSGEQTPIAEDPNAPLSSSDQRFVENLQTRLLQETNLVQRAVADQQAIRDSGLNARESREQQAFIVRTQRIDNQRAQVIQRIGQENAERLGILQQFADLEVALVEQTEGRIAQIRSESARAQTQALLSSFGQLQQLNQKSLGLQRVSIIANTASAVIQSYNNAGGYPYGIVPAGIMAAIGAKQLSQVGKSSFSSTSASAGSGASPGITQPTLSQDPFVTVESSIANDLLNQLNNRDPNELFTGEQVRTLFRSFASLQDSGVI